MNLEFIIHAYQAAVKCIPNIADYISQKLHISLKVHGNLLCLQMNPHG